MGGIPLNKLVTTWAGYQEWAKSGLLKAPQGQLSYSGTKENCARGPLNLFKISDLFVLFFSSNSFMFLFMFLTGLPHFKYALHISVYVSN